MELTEIQKIRILEEAALFRTPEEITEIYRKLGEVKYTAKALGIACYYRGLDVVKALVEGGAKLSDDLAFDADKLNLCDKELLEMGNEAPGIDYSSALMILAPSLYNAGFFEYGESLDLEQIPFEERVKILDYFCENAEKINFDIERFISRVIVFGPEFAFYFLDRISDRLANMIESDRPDKWENFYVLIGDFMNKDFIPCLTKVLSKIGGGKFFYSGNICWNVMKHRFKIPGMYKFFFENFELSEKDKLMVATYIISSETTEIFDLADQNGWFENVELINKLIKFSSGAEKTEFTAWLLNLKNRKFDINAEREKLDKKLSLDNENDAE